MEKKKGDPYTIEQQNKRKKAVYDLHFDFGHSAREISDLLHANRNTINDDLKEFYSEVKKEWRGVSFLELSEQYVKRLEMQRTRLRIQLDQSRSFKEIIVVEKLIMEIDTKIITFKEKVTHQYSKSSE